MDKRIVALKGYVKDNPKKVVVYCILGICFVALATTLSLHFLEVRRTTYAPTRACDLLTVQKAGELLGDKMVNTESNTPTIVDELATSKCSYTDSNPDSSKMKVAAVAVRSAVRESSIEKNKKDFASAKAAQGMKAVKDIGSDAFFNPNLGQLNVYQDEQHRWIILSYGTTEAPEASDLEQVRKLADIVLK